jgi:IMP dehydrogenase/GMP reductase
MSSHSSQPASAGTEPITLSDFQSLSTTLNIHRSLVRLEEKVHVLETTAKSHSENIDTLTKTAYAITYLEREYAQTKKDLNDLGERHNKELHDLALKLEKGLNELGRRLGQDITNLKDGDISELKGLAHTVRSVITFVVALAAGGGLVYVVQHFWPR